MKKVVLAGIGGFIVGMLFLGVVGFLAAPGLMIMEDESTMGFEETVTAIEESAVAEGWKVPATHLIHNSVNKAGYDVLPVAVIELCNEHHAAKVLEEDDTRIVSSLMPCRTAVYETSDGKVIISRMNSGLVSKVFGGVVAKVMAQASADNEVILEVVLP